MYGIVSIYSSIHFLKWNSSYSGAGRVPAISSTILDSKAIAQINWWEMTCLQTITMRGESLERLVKVCSLCLSLYIIYIYIYCISDSKGYSPVQKCLYGCVEDTCIALTVYLCMPLSKLDKILPWECLQVKCNLPATPLNSSSPQYACSW